MSIRDRLSDVRARIDAACVRAGRSPGEVRLVAVSKTKPISFIEEAVAAGQTLFGENYVQEAVEKIASLPSVEWHFVGTLQTNKARAVAGRFALVHSVDRLKLASALNAAALAGDVIQSVLLQVHIGNEATKHGFATGEMSSVLREISTMKGLSVRGLMSLPPLEEQPENSRANFARLRELFVKLRDSMPEAEAAQFSELSMGTSSDFEEATLEGATLVRIGTDIFGARES